MNVQSPKASKTDNATQNAIRLLKRNPAPEVNEDDNTTPEEQARPRETVDTDIVPGRFGEELAPGAEVWRMYLDEEREYYREVVEGRWKSIDAIPVFALLFSAILSVFLFESKGLLRQSPADASPALLTMTNNLQKQTRSTTTITTPEYIPPTSSRWITGTWFVSLGLCLSSAILAIIGKQWLAHPHHSPRLPSRNSLAYIRQSISRIKALEESRALHIIDSLPILLHASFLLFSVGLVLYVWTFDATVAITLAVIAGVTLSFYIETGSLGGICKLREFVMDKSQRTQRALAKIIAHPNHTVTNIDSKFSEPWTQDLRALVWLSKRSADPIIVDMAYQAMAGLHQSSYITADLVHRRPSPTLGSICSDKEESISSLVMHISGRFNDILAGTFEVEDGEPPICRYINAMIALGYCAERPADAPAKYWLEILRRIDRLWTSTLPEQSVSERDFAGILIAEMDVLKFAIEMLQPKLLASAMTRETGLAIDSELEAFNGPGPAHSHRKSVDISPSRDQLDQATADSFLILYNRLAGWLELSLTLLELRANGKTSIDPYLVNGLFRATSNGAHYLKRMYLVLRSIPAPDAIGLNCLKILINLLSTSPSTDSVSIMHLTEALRACIYIAPLILQPLQAKPQDIISFDHVISICDLDSTPPTSRSGILGACVHYIMPLVVYLFGVLSVVPESVSIFNSAVDLAHACAYEDTSEDDDAPRQALRHRIGEYTRVLELIGDHEFNIELISQDTASKICLLATYPINESVPANGLYIPPSCFLTLLRLFSRSLIDARGAQLFIDLILSRMRSPSVSISQLPPQSYPILEPLPSIDYLHQMTRFSDGFPALVQAGSINDDYIPPVSRAIAAITIIAANHDPVLTVAPVEVQTPAVPGFLEALTWRLSHLSSTEAGENIYNRFVAAASSLLVVACEDLESRNLISNSTGRTRLLRELRDNKHIYVEIIGEDEWERLVNGLNLGEVVTETTGNSDEPDEEPENEAPFDVTDTSETNTDSDSDLGTSLENFL